MLKMSMDTLLVILVIIFHVSRGLADCIKTYSESGHVLKYHVIRLSAAQNAEDCLQKCRNEKKCQSINYYSSGKCELNDRTRATHHQDFKREPSGFYFRNYEAEKLGSSNAPSTSCADIKKNHPSSCSRDYWLTINGSAIPSPCHMDSANNNGVHLPCKAITVAGQCCVFPFTYNGLTHPNCIFSDTVAGAKWCSLTADYMTDRKWGYCVYCSTCTTKTGKCCVFPFRYNNKMYNTCTNDGSSSASYWCSLTADYNRDRLWDTCA